MTLAAFAVGITVSAQAQSNTPNSAPADLAAKSDKPQPAADRGTVPPASSPAPKQELKPTVEQEIEALKDAREVDAYGQSRVTEQVVFIVRSVLARVVGVDDEGHPAWKDEAA